MGANLCATSRPLSAHPAPPHSLGQPRRPQFYSGDSQLELCTPRASFWRGIPDESSPTGAKDALGISRGSIDELAPGWISTSSLLHTTLNPQPTTSCTSPGGSRDSGRWLTSGGGGISTSDAGKQVPSNVWSGYLQQDPPPSYLLRNTDVPRFSVSPVEGRDYIPIIDPLATQSPFAPYHLQPFGDNQDMGGIDDYPSPHSERGRRASITTPTSMPGSLVTDHVTPSSMEGSNALQISIRRGEPPRNASNQVYCAHSECAKDPPNFRRPCEWK